jgi:hypothetical protein
LSFLPDEERHQHYTELLKSSEIVFSHTLRTVGWKNAKLAQGSIQRAVARVYSVATTLFSFAG